LLKFFFFFIFPFSSGSIGKFFCISGLGGRTRCLIE
jgi:hypothetical protein